MRTRKSLLVICTVVLGLCVACGAPEPPPGETGTFATVDVEEKSGGTMVAPVEAATVVDIDGELDDAGVDAGP